MYWLKYPKHGLVVNFFSTVLQLPMDNGQSINRVAGKVRIIIIKRH